MYTLTDRTIKRDSFASPYDNPYGDYSDPLSITYTNFEKVNLEVRGSREYNDGLSGPYGDLITAYSLMPNFTRASQTLNTGASVAGLSVTDLSYMTSVTDTGFISSDSSGLTTSTSGTSSASTSGTSATTALDTSLVTTSGTISASTSGASSVTAV